MAWYHNSCSKDLSYQSFEAKIQYYLHKAPDRICTRFAAGASHSTLSRRYRIINQLVDFRYEPARVAEVKRRFLRLDKCIPLEGFLTGWFLGSPIEAIRRGNVEDFVAYGFYSRYMHELPPNVSSSDPAVPPKCYLYPQMLAMAAHAPDLRLTAFTGLRSCRMQLQTLCKQ